MTPYDVCSLAPTNMHDSLWPCQSLNVAPSPLLISLLTRTTSFFNPPISASSSITIILYCPFQRSNCMPFTCSLCIETQRIQPYYYLPAWLSHRPHSSASFFPNFYSYSISIQYTEEEKSTWISQKPSMISSISTWILLQLGSLWRTQPTTKLPSSASSSLTPFIK